MRLKESLKRCSSLASVGKVSILPFIRLHDPRASSHGEAGLQQMCTRRYQQAKHNYRRDLLLSNHWDRRLLEVTPDCSFDRVILLLLL